MRKWEEARLRSSISWCFVGRESLRRTVRITNHARHDVASTSQSRKRLKYQPAFQKGPTRCPALSHNRRPPANRPPKLVAQLLTPQGAPASCHLERIKHPVLFARCFVRYESALSFSLFFIANAFLPSYRLLAQEIAGGAMVQIVRRVTIITIKHLEL